MGYSILLANVIPLIEVANEEMPSRTNYLIFGSPRLINLETLTPRTNQKRPLGSNEHLLYLSGTIKGPVQGIFLIASPPPLQDELNSPLEPIRKRKLVKLFTPLDIDLNVSPQWWVYLYEERRPTARATVVRPLRVRGGGTTTYR